MNKLVEYAKKELKRAGFLREDEANVGLIGEGVVEAIKCWSREKYSKEDNKIALQLFIKLVNFKTLNSNKYKNSKKEGGEKMKLREFSKIFNKANKKNKTNNIYIGLEPGEFKTFNLGIGGLDIEGTQYSLLVFFDAKELDLIDHNKKKEYKYKIKDVKLNAEYFDSNGSLTLVIKLVKGVRVEIKINWF